MDIDVFVQNVKFFCSRKNVKPTVACRESGAGERLFENVKRGSVPSVEKVQLLARYLGVTTSELLGEAAPYPNWAQSPPQELTLHDSTVRLDPSDVKRLTVSEVEMVMAYRAASPEIRRVIDGALEPYKQKETTSAG